MEIIIALFGVVFLIIAIRALKRGEIRNRFRWYIYRSKNPVAFYFLVCFYFALAVVGLLFVPGAIVRLIALNIQIYKFIVTGSLHYFKSLAM
jgi:hypothetical protein